MLLGCTCAFYTFMLQCAKHGQFGPCKPENRAKTLSSLSKRKYCEKFQKIPPWRSRHSGNFLGCIREWRPPSIDQLLCCRRWFGSRLHPVQHLRFGCRRGRLHVERFRFRRGCQYRHRISRL